MQNKKMHTFHIPVMGIGYTIDSPVRVAQYGISSVVSLVDDMLMEKMREFHCKKFGFQFKGISEKVEDFRAKRITSYLNTMDTIVKAKFEELKKSFQEKGSELDKYIEMLPDFSQVKQKFHEFVENHRPQKDLSQWINENLFPGNIDVNIMTKLDKENYNGTEKLPTEFNDAHAALRGFAESDLEASVVLSAGMNPRLYSYFEHFNDFFPDTNGYLKKKVILKVSDYRSALIQAKFLAKKGIWVSEFRIESGLNCGGHAFATEGHLMGPILEEFKINRDALQQSVHELLVSALTVKGKPVPENPLPINITAQGGVGTAEEHSFLMEHYGLDSIGWGSPFLLVPEATSIDEETINLLCAATEKDLYTSGISPLGVPFNSLRTNTKDIEKQGYIDAGRPGSACVKEYASLNREFTEKSICTASRQYQNLKIKELQGKGLGDEAYQKEFMKITDKSCICVGLGTSALLINNLDTKKEGAGVSICPGPNIAFFKRKMSLTEMVGHIYGRNNVLGNVKRPHVFINELKMYVSHFKEMIDESPKPLVAKQKNSMLAFRENLKSGIEYYKKLFADYAARIDNARKENQLQLESLGNELQLISKSIEG
jgi:hypothetical protein